MITKKGIHIDIYSNILDTVLKLRLIGNFFIAGFSIGISLMIIRLTYSYIQFNFKNYEKILKKIDRKLLDPIEIEPKGLISKVPTQYGNLYKRNEQEIKDNVEFGFRMPDGITYIPITFNKQFFGIFEA